MRTQMIKVDFSRIEKFCSGYGGTTAVAVKTGQGRKYFIDRKTKGTVSDRVLNRMQELYNIPPRMFSPSTSEQEFRWWMEANPPPIPRRVKLCDKACRSCQYRGYMPGVGGQGNDIACLYIVHTGKARGCPPGRGCLRRKEGRMLYVPTYFL